MLVLKQYIKFSQPNFKYVKKIICFVKNVLQKTINKCINGKDENFEV